MFHGGFGMFGVYPTSMHHGAAEHAANEANRTARDVAGDIRRLQSRVDRLALVCQGLWELLRERTDLTEEDLQQKVAQIDAADGSSDGKVTVAPVKCSACGRTVSPRQDRCMYCGADREKGSAFH